MTETVTKTRIRHTEEEKAQRLLDSANRVVERLTNKKAALEEQLAPIDSELAKAVARRDYLASNPVLADQKQPADAAEGEPPVDPFVGTAPSGDPFQF